MILVAFLCSLGVALIFAGLYIAVGDGTSALSRVAKVLAPTCCLLLAIVNQNVASAFGGYSLFIIMGMALLICSNSLTGNEKLFYLFSNVTKIIAFLCFALAGVSTINVNIFALLFGLLLGLGVAFILMMIKQKSALENVMNACLLATSFAIVGQSIAMLLSGVGVYAIIYLISGIVLAASQILGILKGQNKVLTLITNITYMLGLVAISASIFAMM